MASTNPQVVHKLSHHVNGIKALAFSPDGRFLASGSKDSTVQIVETSTWKVIKKLTHHKSCVHALAYSPDGHYLASGSQDSTVQIVKTSTWKVIETLTHHKSCVYALTYSPDGHYLASGSEDSTVQIVKTSTGDVICDTPHRNTVYALAYSPDGRFLASGSLDASVHIIEATTGKVAHEINCHKEAVRALAYSPDGRYLATASQDKTIQILKTTSLGLSWEMDSKLTHQKSAVYALAYSPNSRILASGGGNKKIKILETSTEKVVSELDYHTGRVGVLVYSPEGRFLASGSDDKSAQIQILETVSGELAPNAAETSDEEAESLRTVPKPPPERRLTLAELMRIVPEPPPLGVDNPEGVCTEINLVQSVPVSPEASHETPRLVAYDEPDDETFHETPRVVAYDEQDETFHETPRVVAYDEQDETSHETPRLVAYDEPDDDALGPVRGLMNDITNPVVSITDAVKAMPIDIAGELFMANKFVRKRKTQDLIAKYPGLTTCMAAAIFIYTCECVLHEKINELLRNRNRTELRGEPGRTFFPYIRLLYSAIREMSSTQPTMLNRGVKLDLVATNPDKYSEGESLIWWSFSSCTTKLSVLENPQFLGNSGDRTIFQVMTASSVDVSDFSAIPSEAERLLPAGCAFTVTGVLPKSADGLTIISLVDDDDAPKLVQ